MGVSDKSVKAVSDGIQQEYTGQLAKVTATITATATNCCTPASGTMMTAPAAPQSRPAQEARIVQRRIHRRTRSTRRASRHRLRTKASEAMSCAKPKNDQTSSSSNISGLVLMTASMAAMPKHCAAKATGISFMEVRKSLISVCAVMLREAGRLKKVFRNKITERRVVV